MTPSTWPISTPIDYPGALPVSESMSVVHSARLTRQLNPRNPELQPLQTIARGTLRAASYVSSATCMATSYPESVHVGERSAMQNTQPVGQPVRLYTRVKMSHAELMFGAALTGRRTIVISRTTVLSADAQILKQSGGRQVGRRGASGWGRLVYSLRTSWGFVPGHPCASRKWRWTGSNVLRDSCCGSPEPDRKPRVYTIAHLSYPATVGAAVHGWRISGCHFTVDGSRG